jgi:DNA-binding transcriptional ArsR family regulator
MHEDHSDADLLGMLSGGEPRSGALNGTKALLLAVLEDGIRSYLSPVHDIRAEAEYWVGSRRARSPFCFVVICETLGLEPSAVRRALERLRVQRVDPARAIGRTRPNVRRAHRVTRREAG